MGDQKLMQGRGKQLKLMAATAVIAIGLLTAGLAYAYGGPSAAPTSAAHFTVVVGGGGTGDDFTNTIFTPKVLAIYAGDTVTFQEQGRIEPHTVSFGPKKMLGKLAQGLITPVPSKAGPPTLVLSSKVVLPTRGHTYNGSGFANSGILSPDYHGITKTSWTVTFTKPGTYTYYCLVHFPSMAGTIRVFPRPKPAQTYKVYAGYGGNTWVADTYFPENLTVHVGDTVEWSASFHTVTFAPAAKIAALRSQFVLVSKGASGKTVYSVNPAIAFPSDPTCGSTTPCMYGGGYLSSGLLQGNAKGPAVFKVTFTKAGWYHYGCLIHHGMDGNIRVLPAVASRKA
jgi:plastocyanin